MKVGRVTVSDRASAGVYEDCSGPEIERVLGELLSGELEFLSELVQDEIEGVAAVLRRLIDREGCVMVVTTGGTGLGPRDITPEATRRVLDKELPGLAEVMRMESFKVAATAPLSRAVAGVRGAALVLNLPGNPKAIRECLTPLGPAIREALRHLGGDLRH